MLILELLKGVGCSGVNKIPNELSGDKFCYSCCKWTDCGKFEMMFRGMLEKLDIT